MLGDSFFASGEQASSQTTAPTLFHFGSLNQVIPETAFRAGEVSLWAERTL